MKQENYDTKGLHIQITEDISPDEFVNVLSGSLSEAISTVQSLDIENIGYTKHSKQTLINRLNNAFYTVRYITYYTDTYHLRAQAQEFTNKLNLICDLYFGWYTKPVCKHKRIETDVFGISTCKKCKVRFNVDQGLLKRNLTQLKNILPDNAVISLMGIDEDILKLKNTISQLNVEYNSYRKESEEENDNE